MYVHFPYSALKEILKCVSFSYYTSLHNWYTDSTSVFNILQILPKNHYCKHEKFKSKRWIKEFTDFIFQIYLTYPAFSHQDIFFNDILQKCSLSEGFKTCAGLKRQSGLHSPAVTPGKSCLIPLTPAPVTDVNSAFCVSLFHGLTFSKKGLCYSHRQTTPLPIRKLQLTQWDRMTNLIGCEMYKGKKNLILIYRG